MNPTAWVDFGRTKANASGTAKAVVIAETSVVLNLASYTLTVMGVVYASVALVVLLLGSVVLGKEGFSPTGSVFFFGCFSVFFWYNANAFLVSATRPSISLFWSRFTVPGFLIGAAALYHATMMILDSYREKITSIYSFWAIALVLSGFGGSSEVIVEGVYRYDWGFFPRYASTGSVAIIFVFVLFSMVFRKFWDVYQKAREESRQSHLLRLMMVGFGFGMASTVDWFPVYGVEVPPAGALFILGFVVVFTHIMVNYSLDPLTPEFAAEEIVETMRDGLVVTDQNAMIKMNNDSLRKMLDYDVDELEGEPLEKIMPPSQFGQRLSGHETSIRSKKDDRVTVSLSSSRLEDWGGNLLGWVMVMRDIRDRKEAEKKLKESEERFRQLAENIEDVFWLYDLEQGEFLYWSPSYEDVFGDPVEKAPVTARDWAEHLSAQKDEFNPDDLRDRLTSGEEISLHYKFERPGVTRWINEQGVPVRDEQGRVYRMAGLARDETEIRQKNELIRGKNRELEQFAHAASHDLKEPLRRLKTFCDFAREDLEERNYDDLASDIEDIEESVRTMEQLIQALLQLSRAGRNELHLEKIELDGLIEDALDSYSDEINERSATVEFPENPPAVTADRDLLKRVLEHLLDNALKYSENSPCIEVLVESRDESTVLGLRDDGVGIDPVDSERIFRPFEQLHSEEAYQGTGMGLGICKKIVERHGGEIWLNTDWTEGTHIEFSLADEPGAIQYRTTQGMSIT